MEIFGDKIVDIQHFGLTSIKNLSSKPIIDILILVENIEDADDYNR